MDSKPVHACQFALSPPIAIFGVFVAVFGVVSCKAAQSATSADLITVHLTSDTSPISIRRPVIAKVKVTNVSISVLNMPESTSRMNGQSGGFLFNVVDQNGNPVSKRHYDHEELATWHISNRSLKPGEAYTSEFDLARLYDLTAPGQYSVTVSRYVNETSAWVASNQIFVQLQYDPPEIVVPPGAIDVSSGSAGGYPLPNRAEGAEGWVLPNDVYRGRLVGLAVLFPGRTIKRVVVIRYIPGDGHMLLSDVRAALLELTRRELEPPGDMIWSEMTTWTIDGSIEFSDGGSIRMLTDGWHTCLIDATGHTLFFRISPNEYNCGFPSGILFGRDAETYCRSRGLGTFHSDTPPR